MKLFCVFIVTTIIVGNWRVVLPDGSPTITQHHYVEGEVFHYAFEDTESTFGVSGSGVLVPTTLDQYQELEIPFSISILKSKSGLIRKLRFNGGSYRGSKPDKFNATQPAELSKIIANFPGNFSYEYLTDEQAVTKVVGSVYAPYRSNPIGNFVFYKALDIHTIQGVIDKIPATTTVGDTIQRPAQNIPLPDGTFHNAATTIYFQRVENINGIPCGYFKVVTMGNTYTTTDSKMYTNYQYTFDVPLNGPYQGLLLRGELEETVTAPPHQILQRQFSINLIPQ